MKPSAAHDRKVLILDGDIVPALSVARSLGRYGLEVTVASPLPDTLARWSRHVAHTVDCPDPMRDEAAFVAWLVRIARQAGYALVVPVSERTARPCFRHRHELDGLPLALPDNASLAVAFDKTRTFDLARQLDIPVPRGANVRDAARLAEAARGLAFPVVVKPASSIGSTQTGAVSLAVDYAFDAADLERKVEYALRFGEVILQEYFAGQGVGIELIAARGKIVYAFQHLRLHEIPLTGGGSSLRKSVAVEPVLLEAAGRLIAALDWHGVAMVEFKWNPATRAYRLMEINGRFWGSLPLALAAGADFPAMLFELATQGRIAPRPPATTGIVCRKLSADLYWHEQVLRGASLPAGLPPPPGRRELRHSLALLLSPRHRFDVQSLGDPVPGLVDLGRIARLYWQRASGRLRDRLLLRRQRARWRKAEVARSLAEAKTLLFVCHGNINRSALAEQCYLQEGKPGARAGNFPVSAGFHERAGRPADPVMVALAREHGVNMDGCVSRTLDSTMVEQADLIFVMELRHLRRIARAYPGATRKTFLLGLADESRVPLGEIADPYGQPRAVYERCFHQVRACVGRLVARQTAAASQSHTHPERRIRPT